MLRDSTWPSCHSPTFYNLQRNWKSKSKRKNYSYRVNAEANPLEQLVRNLVRQEFFKLKQYLLFDSCGTIAYRTLLSILRGTGSGTFFESFYHFCILFLFLFRYVASVERDQPVFGGKARKAALERLSSQVSGDVIMIQSVSYR
jgi:hypothetical protein